jgi:hypothetical protein
MYEMAEGEEVAVNTVYDEENSKEVQIPKKRGGVPILVFLLILVSIGLLYYVLKDNGYDLLKGVFNTENDVKIVDEISNEESTSEEAEVKETLTLDNSGWALFALPEYGFSVEIPPYIIDNIMFEKDASSDWRIGHHDVLPESYKSGWRKELVDNFEHYVFIRFFPMYSLGSELGGGLGAFNEHNVDIFIYRKDSSDSLFKNRWIEYLEGCCPVGDDNCTLDIKEERKWDSDVISYITTFPTGMGSGYLLLGNSYIFELKFYINPSNPESEQIALKVLDSMKFE